MSKERELDAVDKFMLEDGVMNDDPLGSDNQQDDFDDNNEEADYDDDLTSEETNNRQVSDTDDDETLKADSPKKLDKPAKSANRKEVNDQRQAPRDEDLRPRADGLAYDKSGNIVDPKTKQIIARNGTETRLYDKAQRLKQQVEELSKLHTNAAKMSADLQALNELPKQLGITNDELSQGITLIAKFKRNPIEAAREIVALTLATGQYNVSDILGKDVGDAIELRGLDQMINKRLEPLQQIISQNNSERQREAEAIAARQKAQEFLDSHEHANVHAVDIDKLLGQNPDLDPKSAYYELRLFAAQNGLDFSRPLGPQIAALAREQSNSSQLVDGYNRKQQTPLRASRTGLPNGSRAGMNVQDIKPASLASPNDSWENIIRTSIDALRR